jgi:SAM-dependent methyltransferase
MMNEAHETLCSSAEWGEYLATDVLPKVLASADLGEHLLEIGPGFGLATDVLRTMASRVTAVEADVDYASTLAGRFAGTNVDVVVGDATALRFEDSSFTSAASFTMLHHVPSAALQDTLLAEVARVVKPGGVFVGSDSLDSPGFRSFHEGDICNPVVAEELGGRLKEAGFSDIRVSAEWVSPEGEDEVFGTVSFVARTAAD